ncbi:MAG: phytanoyl-CoA dioxygenase family protein [Verrucomicrobiae bacterium]|nr:phytanoyl-CoA dioxygenase family protein [Verrucomicrobiae bacterium]
MSGFSLPEVDALLSDKISETDATFFREHGVLLMKNVISPEELAVLKEESMALVEKSKDPELKDPDFKYATHPSTDARVPFRIDYLTHKMLSARVLLAHPFILNSVEMLCGRNFIPTWESKVFKLAGTGAAVNWHRDAGPALPDEAPVFFADFYLDDADETTALRAIPGSQKLSRADAMDRINALNEAEQFEGDDIVILPMKAGDVLFHNVHTLHGSPAASSALRRVVYFAFRSIEVEKITSPNMPAFIPAKQRVLAACMQARANAPYTQGETPFVYAPDSEWAPPADETDFSDLNYRIPHLEL